MARGETNNLFLLILRNFRFGVSVQKCVNYKKGEEEEEVLCRNSYTNACLFEWPIIIRKEAKYTAGSRPHFLFFIRWDTASAALLKFRQNCLNYQFHQKPLFSLHTCHIYRHFGIKLRKHWIFFPPAFCHIQSKQTKFLGTEKVVTLLLSR